MHAHTHAAGMHMCKVRVGRITQQFLVQTPHIGVFVSGQLSFSMANCRARDPAKPY